MIERKKKSKDGLQNAKTEIKRMIESIEDGVSSVKKAVGKSRKEMRKEERMLKKLRNDAFHHHRKVRQGSVAL